MFKLGVYIPKAYLEAVKTAMFAAGAGRIGHYDSCCWQTSGQGQFRPLDGSKPFIGRRGQLESVEEYRVELVCSDELIRDVVSAMQASHPYEEPAYDVVKLESF